MINRKRFFECFANEAAEDRFTQGKAYRFLYDLHSLGLLFHLDEDPFYIITHDAETKVTKNTFTPEEAQMLQELIVPKLFSTPLPQYDNDPHKICIEVGNSSSETYRTLPQWGFSFDDEPDNNFAGFTSPQRWNGMGCPLLRFGDMKRLLETGGYTYDAYAIYRRGKSALPKFAVFIVTGSEDGAYPLNEQITLEGQMILNTEGDQCWVYPTDQLGLCFNIDDCLEPNVEDWVGYF